MHTKTQGIIIAIYLHFINKNIIFNLLYYMKLFLEENVMVQRCQKCYLGTYFNVVIYVAVL